MSDEQKILLKEANVPVEWQNNCYITDTNMIFTPYFDESNNMLKTGEEIYNEWIATSKNSSTSTTQ